MTVYQLPALDWAAPIVDPRTGRPTPYLQRFWQNLKITAVDGANQNGAISTLQAQITVINGQITVLSTSVAGKAPLASPALTGTPTAPTAAVGTNTTQVATTAFVAAAVASTAPLASPAFTGNPTAPTPAPGDDDTSVATTAFVQARFAGALAKSTFATWTAATGTAERTAFATYDAPTASAAYDQAEMQAVMDALQDVSRRMKALIDDVTT